MVRYVNDFTIAVCDENDGNQKFDYFEGRIILRAKPGLCVGYETSKFNDDKAPVTAMSCFSNSWGQ